MPIALQMWMVKAAPQVREGGMPLFVGNFQISIALGPLTGGAVVDRFGLISTFYFGGALGIAALLIIGCSLDRLRVN